MTVRSPSGVESFFKKLKKSLDITSTPPAPKIGRIPLPDVGEGELYLHLDTTRDFDDEGSIESDRLSSPQSPGFPKRKESISISRGSTPQSRSASRTSSSSYPHPPTPGIVAPTPRWNVGATLREEGWKSCTPVGDVAKPGMFKDRRSSSKTRPSTTSPSPPPSTAPSLSQLKERTLSPASDIRHIPSRPRPRASSSTSRPPPTPLSSRITERTLTPQPDSLKRPLKGILKSTAPKVVPLEPIPLHWQLLPYDSTRCKKKLFFDVTQSVSCIRDHSRMPPLALSNSDLDKPAANTALTRMTIQCRLLPYWEIIVENPAGITCRDIFCTIHDSLHTTLTDAERDIYVTDRRRAKVQEAFTKRCRDTPELDEYTRQRGMMRVDLLEGKRIFMGLSRPPDEGEFWVLDMGAPLSRH